jgi:uncharacterized membrane protein
MTRGTRAVLRGTLVALLALGYALLSHISNSRPGASTLGVVLAIGPLLLLAAAIAWRSRRPLVGLSSCGLAAGITYACLPILRLHFAWVYLIQQSAAYALLSFTFARTLAHGRTPLCTRFARMTHGSLDSAAERYTRQVTLSWSVFFGAMTFVLVGLFLLAPLRIWSIFANFCALPLIAAMFVAEYAVRGWALPQMKHGSILEGVRAYLASDADGRDMSRG